MTDQNKQSTEPSDSALTQEPSGPQGPPVPTSPPPQLFPIAGAVIGLGLGYFIGFQSLSEFGRLAHYMFWEDPSFFEIGELFSSGTFWKIALPSLIGIAVGAWGGKEFGKRLAGPQS